MWLTFCIDAVRELLNEVVKLLGSDHVERFKHDLAQLAHVDYVMHRFR